MPKDPSCFLWLLRCPLGGKIWRRLEMNFWNSPEMTLMKTAMLLIGSSSDCVVALPDRFSAKGKKVNSRWDRSKAKGLQI